MPLSPKRTTRLAQSHIGIDRPKQRAALIDRDMTGKSYLKYQAELGRVTITDPWGGVLVFGRFFVLAQKH